MNRWHINGRSRFIFVALVLALFITGALSSSSLNLKAQGGTWEGRYWNNRNLSGAPALTRQDAAIDFDWGAGSPDPLIQPDNFSAQWTQTASLPAGTYRFSSTMDDGMRLWIDNVLLVDTWMDGQARTITVDVYLNAGNHNITVQYYEAGGVAVARMNFVLISGGGLPTPPVPGDQWFNEYFSNPNLSGAPALTGTTSAVNFNWGFGSPAPGFPADFFSVRWVRNLNLEPGRYRFTATADDGVRVWVNNALIIDQWRIQAPTTFNAEIDISGGQVPVKVEYFEQTERAQVSLNWARIAAPTPPPPPPPPPAQTGFAAQYFNNRDLAGAPVLTRNDPAVNFNWGHGSPGSQVPVDNFSARWTANMNFAPGRYRFSASSDDGVRVWVNNQLIIDAWRDQPVQTFTADVDLSGTAPVRIEYYEATNLAEMRFSYSQLSGQTGTGGAFPGTATVTSYRLNVRQGPGTNFGIITTLSTGNTVNLTGHRNGDATWVRVSLPNGAIGWVSALYVRTSIPVSSLVPIVGSDPLPPPSTQPGATVITGALNVRTGPGVGFPSFTQITNGATVTLLGRNAAATWVKVALRDGRQGWVNVHFLSTNVPVSSLPVLSN